MDMAAQNWVMIISELRRYQGVCYKSDITVLSGLDLGDRQVLEQKYSGCDPPCLLDSSDGRFVLKGPIYNPMDVMNILMCRRGYRMQGEPQQRTIPNTQNKDDKFCLIYHLSKECALRRANTTPAGLSTFGSSGVNNRVTSAPPKLTQVPDVTQSQQQQQQQQSSHHSNVSLSSGPALNRMTLTKDPKSDQKYSKINTNNLII